MRTRALVAVLLCCAACESATPPSYAPSSSPQIVATASSGPSAAPTASASPTTAATSSLSPPPTRVIADMDFALMSGAADLRIDAALSRGDDEILATTVAADVPAVESEFERTFAMRPVIYVFGSVESYTEGFVRIFGYSRATATFVAENSVSFFEPSLRVIAVNWEAVRARRPIAAIRHELTHLLTLDACSPRCDLVPAWLNEGQARLAEALVPGGEWRLLRVRYEAASMAVTGTILPLGGLVSQLSMRSRTGPDTSSTRSPRAPSSCFAKTSAGTPRSRASTSASGEVRTSRRPIPRSPTDPSTISWRVCPTACVPRCRPGTA